MKIALGMSGGVDSSLSAHLLKEAGYEVIGVFLQCWRAPGCRADEDRQDALKVALDLQIPFQVLDFVEEYKEKVVARFFEDYKNGLTPNPDVWCNTAIKFGLFYDWAMDHGFDAVATGHYARIGEFGGKKALLRGIDVKKDQTYFLYRTGQDQLDHIVFPIGGMTKEEVRQAARERGLANANKPDSQGICFIGDINVRDFLKDNLGEKPGDVLDAGGNVIGQHRGVWFYTIGQRHGFELLPKVRLQNNEWKHILPPLYVISKDAKNNTITVGYGAKTLKSQVEIRDIFWRRPDLEPELEPKPKNNGFGTNPNSQTSTSKFYSKSHFRDKLSQNYEERGAGAGRSASVNLLVRIRHGGQLYPAKFSWLDKENHTGQLDFAEGIRGLAAGQAAVFYHSQNSEVCLGGAVLQ